MRQNEKILVYVVTGFLLVILAVAVIFGRDGSPRAVVSAGDPGAGQPVVAGATGHATGQKSASLEDVLRGQGNVLADAGDAKAGEAKAAPGLGEQPLVVSNVQLAPPSPAEEVAMLLGRSRRDRDCRIVTARPGDTLRELVLRWCGGLDGHLSLAERLNEDGTMLRVGQSVVLPWVDDEALLAAMRERQPRPAVGGVAPAVPTEAAATGSATTAPSTAAAPAPANPPSAAAFRVYVVKAGDMLWKIAEREVGARGAPAFIANVRELNPDLDVDTLRVGQEIRLPPKS